MCNRKSHECICSKFTHEYTCPKISDKYIGSFVCKLGVSKHVGSSRIEGIVVFCPSACSWHIIAPPSFFDYSPTLSCWWSVRWWRRRRMSTWIVYLTIILHPGRHRGSRGDSARNVLAWSSLRGAGCLLLGTSSIRALGGTLRILFGLVTAVAGWWPFRLEFFVRMWAHTCNDLHAYFLTDWCDPQVRTSTISYIYAAGKRWL